MSKADAIAELESYAKTLTPDNFAAEAKKRSDCGSCRCVSVPSPSGVPANGGGGGVRERRVSTGGRYQRHVATSRGSLNAMFSRLITGMPWVALVALWVHHEAAPL